MYFSLRPSGVTYVLPLTRPQTRTVPPRPLPVLSSTSHASAHKDPKGIMRRCAVAEASGVRVSHRGRIDIAASPATHVDPEPCESACISLRHPALRAACKKRWLLAPDKAFQ